ncbi:8713_t:CDS:1, partial [Acaulospora morrowiae]
SVILRRQLSNLIDFVYLNFIENSGNMNYMIGRAILTPNNNQISDLIMNGFQVKFTCITVQTL